MPSKLNEDIVQKAIDNYKNGMMVKDAAASAGISKTALVTYLSKRGISRKEEYRKAKQFSDSIDKSNITLNKDELTHMHFIKDEYTEYLNSDVNINKDFYNKN